MATSPIVNSVQVQLGLFLAQNNVRRSAANLAANYLTSDGATSTTTVTINPGATYTWRAANQPTSVTCISVSAPLIADINTDASTVAADSVPAASYRVPINALALLDAPIDQIVFRNPQTYAVRLHITHG